MILRFGLLFLVLLISQGLTEEWRPVKRRPTSEYIAPSLDSVQYWERRPVSGIEYQHPPRQSGSYPVPPFMLLPPSLKDSSYLDLWTSRDHLSDNNLDEPWKQSNISDISSVNQTHVPLSVSTTPVSFTTMKPITPIQQPMTSVHHPFMDIMNSIPQEMTPPHRPMHRPSISDILFTNRPMPDIMDMHIKRPMSTIVFPNRPISEVMTPPRLTFDMMTKTKQPIREFDMMTKQPIREFDITTKQPILETTTKPTTTTTTEDPTINLVEPMQLIIEGHSKVRKYGVTYLPFKLAHSPVFKKGEEEQKEIK